MNASAQVTAIPRTPKITIQVKKPGGVCEEYVYEASAGTDAEPLLTVYDVSPDQPALDLLALAN